MISFLKWAVFGSLLLHFAAAAASANTLAKVLRVYGPGGPHHVLEECADLFEDVHGVAVAVVKTLPYDLERKLSEDGDIYYGGAEYMLDNFNRLNPGVLDMATAEKLHPRRIGIIVRKGNPHNIKGIDDLSRKGVDLLDVKLENMRDFYGAPSDELKNVRHLEYTGHQGFMTWSSDPEIDAWVTYRSWHVLLDAEDDFIEIPGDKALRYTPIAVTRRTLYQKEALAFINFLKSEQAGRIFAEHGWD